ncbi:hypothetical protein BSZ19_35465 [Bradyrhizobium japonicum]|uniref:argininosuccinate lyase n=1 Tax=Bradyrhizobium japonicum TaxID=375 RepID=A0A1Y2JE71_BRAJP|nr:lyase family protein [Bradyrhizobium japonicum]OSJ26568.1 hypothetical protein BSZ19_35465 [Bradyrhizobium japonicum]
MTNASSEAAESSARVLELDSRLNHAPSRRLVEAAFAEDLAAQAGLASALDWVDIAHTLTLAREGMTPAAPARELLAALRQLEATSECPPWRAEDGDLYTNREAWLVERTPAAGWLGMARARREALTTAFHMTVREKIIVLALELIEAAKIFVAHAKTHRFTIMSDYTYLQAAQPTTFGHYLLGFVSPMLRDLDRLDGLYARFNLSPAGIGSSNGSLTFQNRAELARRLGFAAPVAHARDAMWQSDLAIEALSNAVTCVVSTDRLAEDLMVFTTGEFGTVRLSDCHSRASKIMPNKRNPFALAYVRGAANRLIGLQAAMAAAARTPSGQMDNRMQAYEAVPQALGMAARVVGLMGEVVAELSVDRSRAVSGLKDREVCAADLAERLTVAIGIDYRAAHRSVGRMMRQLADRGRSLGDVSADEVAASVDRPDAVAEIAGVLALALDLDACVSARGDVGGCAAEEVLRLANSHAEWMAATKSIWCDRQIGLRRAKNQLDAEVSGFLREVS